MFSLRGHLRLFWAVGPWCSATCIRSSLTYLHTYPHGSIPQ